MPQTMRGPDGDVIEVPDEAIAYRKQQGYQPYGAAQRATEIQGAPETRGVLGSINAGVSGLASGLTLGGSDMLLGSLMTDNQRDRMRAEIAEHPGLRTAGELAGGIAASVAAPGSILSRTPAGYLSGLANAGTEAVRAGSTGLRAFAGQAAITGGEAAIQNAGQYLGSVALGDRKLTAEGLGGALGTGFALGAAGGAAVYGIERGSIAARNLFSRVMEGGDDAARSAAGAWERKSTEIFDANRSTLDEARRQVSAAEQATQEANVAKLRAGQYVDEEQLLAQRVKGMERPGPAPEPAPIGAAGLGDDVGGSAGRAVDDVAGSPTLATRPSRPVKAPEGFDPAASSDGVAVFDGKPSIREGLPGVGDVDRATFREQGFVVRPSELAAREVRGIESGADMVASSRTGGIKEAWGKGERVPAIEIDLTPSGKYVVADGNHRLVAAAIDGDRPVLARVRPIEYEVESADRIDLVLKRAAGPEMPALPPPAQALASKVAEADDAESALMRALQGTKQQLDQGATIGEVSARRAFDPRGSTPIPRKNIDAASASEQEALLRSNPSLKGAFDEYAPHASGRRFHECEGAFGMCDRATDEFIEAARESSGIQPYTFDLTSDKGIERVRRLYHLSDGDVAAYRKRLDSMLEDVEPEDIASVREDFYHKVAVTPDGVVIDWTANQFRDLPTPYVYRLDKLERAQSGGPLHEIDGMTKAMGRYEKAMADVADEMGEAAHPLTREMADGLRKADSEAERHMLDRATQAIDDHAEGAGAGFAKVKEEGVKAGVAQGGAPEGPVNLPPKERIAYARERAGEAKVAHSTAAANEAEARLGLKTAQKRADEVSAAADVVSLPKPGAEAAARGGALANLGTALEVAGAVGIPGLPKPSDLPIIGPVLGLWLKARALKAGADRLMGRVPATGNAKVASLAAKVKDRAANAVDKMLGGIQAGAPKIRAVVAPAAPVLLDAVRDRIYDDGQPAPAKTAGIQEHVAARAREISALVANPPLIAKQVRREMRDVSDPDMVNAAVEFRTAQLNYLNGVAPKPPPPSPFDHSPWRPDRASATDFARRYAVAMDPIVALEQVEQRCVTPEAAEAFRAVYPLLFQQTQQRLLEKASSLQQRLPPAQLTRMSIVFKLPLDSSLEPANLSLSQSVFAPSSPAEPVPTPGQPTSSIAGPTNLTALYQTAMDRRAAAR